MVKIDLLLHMWTSTGSELSLSPLNPPPIKNLPEPSAKFPNDKNAKNPRKHMLFSFRAKRFNSYYDTAVNTKVRHSVKFENVFKTYIYYTNLCHDCVFFSPVYITAVLPMGSVLKFNLCKHINTCGSKAITTISW